MRRYFNSCGRGLPSARSLDAMRAALEDEETATLVGQAEQARAARAAARQDAARLLGAAPASVGFASSTSAAWLGIAARLPLDGKRVLVAPHEWGANIRFLEARARKGALRLEVLAPLEDAGGDLSVWAERIDSDVGAIFAPMVSSIDGLRYPAAALGALPRPEGCRLVLDAAQALGQTPIDAATLGADAIVATARKWLRGPRGAAVFQIAPDLADSIAIAEIEPGDTPAFQIAGLQAAIAEALEAGVATIEAEIADRRAQAAAAAARLGLEEAAPRLEAPTGALTLATPRATAKRLEAGLREAGFTVKFPNRALDEPFAPTKRPDAASLRISAHRDVSGAAIAALFERIAALL